ncbi:asparagine synthetase B [Ktedonobacteria bacterium brp13]|nr:asparagine synthetase B [Ktedonobacteria bacterium brp13]
MCGITGWVDWTDNLTHQRDILEQMNNTMCRRGPDAEGFWLAQHVAFGHRRLIVIDALGGKQPMEYVRSGQDEAHLVITYNGEIYNFQELRDELKRYGHAFHSRSDTEVLLHSYIEWGEDCVKHLNGIFAFAIWDETRQQLFMARDHLGVKPLFYAQRGSTLVFGSEIKALLAHPKIEPELDAQGIAELFGSSFLRLPGSAIFAGIQQLRPAHTLTFSRERLSIKRYWNVQSAPHTDDVETTAEHIRSLLEDTVKRQLISDMPIVTLLSGGLDSSALTSLAARDFVRQQRTLDTYSMDFVGSDQDFESSAIRPSLDGPWVARVSEYAKTRHHTVMLDTAELIENHLVPMHAHDLPAMGQMETSLYLLFKEMKRNATVALSGESADEVFGGYPWFKPMIEGNTLNRMPMMNRFGATLLKPEIEQRIHTTEIMAQRNHDNLAETPLHPDDDPLTIRMRQTFYLHMTRFLPMLLDRKDRMSMQVGFEVRVPFCDYRLVEYAWNIPWQMKTIDNIEKGILRRALNGVLPDDALYRKKSAYPSTQNPGFYQALQDWADHILEDPQEPINQLIDTANVRTLISQQPDDGSMMASAEIRGRILDSIIQTNAWLKDYHVTIKA